VTGIDIDDAINEGATGSDLIVDGRTARRNRNKDAVLDALVALANEGNDEPPIELIAERAGVSYRSVYRYFDDRTDLMLSAITRVMGELWPIFDVEQLGGGSLDDRIARLTSVRLTAYRKLAPLTRNAVRRRANEPAVAKGYDRVREYLRDQLAQQFEPELTAMPAGDGKIALAALDAMFQFEVLDYLTVHGDMSEKDLARLLDRHVRAHLAT
jgi:AcrR family transcriptional regulator